MALARAHACSTRCEGRSSATRSGRSRTSPAGCGRGGSRAAPFQGRAMYSSTVRVGTSPVPRRSRSPEVPWWTAWLWRQLRERLEDEQAGEAADPQVRSLGRQERAVGAVVEDDERPQQEARRRNRQGEGDPDRDVEAEVHRHGQRQIGHHRGGHVDQAAAPGRCLMSGNRAPPEGGSATRIGVRRDSGGRRGRAHGRVKCTRAS